jgi:subtilisin-like proprotein convertase family protein
MPAITYNFIVEQGSDFELRFQYNDAANNPINLSSSNNEAIFSLIPDSGSNLRFSSSDNLNYQIHKHSLSADDQGFITLKFNSAFTNDFTFTTATYDLDVIILSNNIAGNTRIATGTITLLPRISTYPQFDVTADPGSGDTGGGDNNDGGNGSVVDADNLCSPTECSDLDVYSVVYTGSGLTIPNTFNSVVSGYVNTIDMREIENVELSINKLDHTSVQDLQLLLAPPSGDKILLSANDKIGNYVPNFSFMFSNKASNDTYLYNVANGYYCNILDKTSLVNYNNETLLSSFDHLIGVSGLTGDWNLIVRDTDPVGSGYIDGWKLVVTYKPE